MNKIKEKGRKILRKIYAGIGLSAVAFVFQACYGTPQSTGNDTYLQGFVKSKTTNNPIMGIKVSVKDMYQYEITDSTGKFQLYVAGDNFCTLQLDDIDSTENGSYLSKAITVDLSKHRIDLGKIFLNEAE
ncbi:MAG: hypothetical protein LBE13_10785 [Bacteroidales bacterium]|jgi:hypothetical protein|nr:hypothetical protein [Bacteroidales bacterium]